MVICYLMRQVMVDHQLLLHASLFNGLLTACDHHMLAHVCCHRVLVYMLLVLNCSATTTKRLILSSKCSATQGMEM